MTLMGLSRDELKTLQAVDHHPHAIAANNGLPGQGMSMIDATLSIFADCNQAARAITPHVHIISFIYSHLPDDVVAPWAATPGLMKLGVTVGHGHATPSAP